MQKVFGRSLLSLVLPLFFEKMIKQKKVLTKVGRTFDVQVSTCRDFCYVKQQGPDRTTGMPPVFYRKIER